MSRWSLVGAWVVVAALATTLTWQIVSAADAQVSDRPVGALDVGALESTTSSTVVTIPEGSGATTANVDVQSTTSVTQGSTPTNGPGGSSPTSTTTPTAPAAAWQVRTITTGGGSVVVSYRPGEVVLQTAAPGPGFAAEIKKQGPPEVDVEFESVSAKYRVEAKWDNANLAVEIDSDLAD